MADITFDRLPAVTECGWKTHTERIDCNTHMLTEIHNSMEVITSGFTDADQLKMMEQRKKTRRGKKNNTKHRFVDDLGSHPIAGSENSRVPDCSCGSTPRSGYKPYERTTPSPQKSSRKSRKGKLRPFYSPKAPHNDNQFLMEDRLGNNSFEENLNIGMLFVEDFPFSVGSKSVPTSPEKESSEEEMSESEFSPKYEPKYNTATSPFNDFNFEYSYGDDDHDSRFNFYEQDFEEFYKTSREDELSTLSRDQLIESVVSLEKRLTSLEKTGEPKKEKTSEDSMQNMMYELRMLQEENQRLKEECACDV